jgi:hypothetical protein
MRQKMRTNAISDQSPSQKTGQIGGHLATKFQRSASRKLRIRKQLKVRYSPIKAIRHFCVDCCGGSNQAITYCADIGCSLWYYRLGKRPTAGDELMDTKNFIEDGKFWAKVCGDE